ncbi:hypothetical protein BSKO_08745 [Bryopsis sp. KO-2023]|nr:hypothetical protein BSKO_08745 [Bryopsis sp. KO-2023]
MADVKEVLLRSKALAKENLELKAEAEILRGEVSQLEQDGRSELHRLRDLRWRLHNIVGRVAPTAATTPPPPKCKSFLNFFRLLLCLPLIPDETPYTEWDEPWMNQA